MKGVPGLLIAVGLGIVGAFCNWMYLAQMGKDMQTLDFIGVSDNVKINAGDKFSEAHFMKVSIPGNNLGNLDKVAVKWEARATVVGQPATKSYSPGEILLWHDLRTPPELDIKKLLSADERVLWIPVDTRTFVPALVNAGDNVSFIVPRVGGTFPTPADDPAAAGKAAPMTETIGPFRILALGNRLGSPEVLRAAGQTPSQENVMAVAVRVVGGEFDEKGQKLLDTLRLTNFQQCQVILHPSPEAARAGK
ncbi:MAG: hypothetical protein ACM3U2_09985 [Deltaproteobacteria bacterium]